MAHLFHLFPLKLSWVEVQQNTSDVELYTHSNAYFVRRCVSMPVVLRRMHSSFDHSWSQWSLMT